MRELAERAYFVLCLALGRLLRSGKYSKARIVYQHGERQVRKYRLFYAPLLVWLGRSLLRILDTGVRVLPQRDWEERERRVHWRLRGTGASPRYFGARSLSTSPRLGYLFSVSVRSPGC